ncbi:glycosyl transferase [Leptolyngbya sp. PCC 7375]|nr:glycosyl transferase [Leptolyngbya sp. PCC 7375]
MLNQITPVILTYNEEPNIERTLKKLDWAERIIVVDSFSTDATLDILTKYPKVDVFKRKFDSHSPQWNYGLDQVETDWILSLDSDYVLPDELIAEIAELNPEDSVDGYFARFKYCVFGKPLRGTILPPRQILSRKDRSSYINDGHTQLLQVKGESGYLKNYIHHDDRKALSRWLWAQDRYMLIEVDKLRHTPNSELSLGDRIRKWKVLAPFIILLYCLILRGGILDGWYGYYYAFQRMFAEILLSLRLIEKEFR